MIPASGDSDPGAPPSVPDLALWGDSNKGAPIDASASFPSRPSNVANEHTATIGHIGRYTLKHQLGAGGLGTVYAAHDPLLSRLIAVKTLHLEIAEDQRAAFNALFLNEARAAAGLSHPQIVTVFDAGISDDRAYIAMELLKGRDLRQLRQEGWRPSPAQAALIVRRVADALSYAHSKGVVHRDVKPANIFMVGRTQPRVLDFGIARVAHRRDASAGTELAAGSPYYMAPEQARQQPVDRRADVFSLGVVLYELLTDTKPFRGASLAEITEAVVGHEPALANAVDPAVPPRLAEIAARAMEKDPERRYRSARVFAQDLRLWLEENPEATETEAAVAPPRHATAPWIGGIVLACVLLGAFAWIASAPRISPPATVSTLARTEPASAPAIAVVLPAAASALAQTSPSAFAPNAAGSAATVAAAPLSPALLPQPAAAASMQRPAIAAVREAPKVAAGRESAAEKKARDARERATRLNGAAAAPVVVATGVVKIAISPWGKVEVDGIVAGVAPPLNELTLPEGKHQIVIRNEDFPPYSASVNVTQGQPVTLKFRFGS